MITLKLDPSKVAQLDNLVAKERPSLVQDIRFRVLELKEITAKAVAIVEIKNRVNSKTSPSIEN